MYFPGAASLLMIRGREVSVSSCSYLIPSLQIPSPVEEGRSSESALRGGGSEVEEHFHIHYIYITRAREWILILRFSHSCHMDGRGGMVLGDLLDDYDACDNGILALGIVCHHMIHTRCHPASALVASIPCEGATG